MSEERYNVVKEITTNMWNSSVSANEILDKLKLTSLNLKIQGALMDDTASGRAIGVITEEIDRELDKLKDVTKVFRDNSKLIGDLNEKENPNAEYEF